MATTPEGRVKAQCKRLLKEYKAYFTMPVMAGMATNGTPDFAVCANGRYLAIEAKADASGTPTELQWVRLCEVQRAGGSTMVINDSNLHILMAWLADTSMVVHVVRELDSRRVLHHAVNGRVE
jgi:hypothetical protein